MNVEAVDRLAAQLVDQLRDSTNRRRVSFVTTDERARRAVIARVQARLAGERARVENPDD